MMWGEEFESDEAPEISAVVLSISCAKGSPGNLLKCKFLDLMPGSSLIYIEGGPGVLISIRTLSPGTTL